jgi:hypothetical protein
MGLGVLFVVLQSAAEGKELAVPGSFKRSVRVV